MDVQTPSTSLKISMGSNLSNPISDKDLFGEENRKLYNIIIIFIIADFILNEIIIIKDSGIAESDNKKKALILLLLYTFISIIIFGSILLLLNLKKLLLSKIVRFSYLIIGILYYAYQVVMTILIFSEDDFNLDPLDIIIFIIISLTLIPRIVVFLFVRVYERTIIKINKAKIAEEHEMFIEKVVNKLDRSTTNNLKENELEKELDKCGDEEIIFTMNKDEVVVDSKKNNNNQSRNKNKIDKRMSKEEEVEEEEVADLS